ncbi:MAG: SCO family protein [Betaproteobacteria bacterium]|nr:SCO family protein [Betaproteobacteria bacterium]
MSKKTFPLFIFGAGLWLLAAGAGAHSSDEVLKEMQEQDRYIQMVNYEAPGFALEDPHGRKVSLADFRGKAVVLNFIYARCKELCPLHSELIAKIQAQVNATLMRDLVQFVTIATDTEDAAATAQVMRGHGKIHGLDPANWVFLYRGSGAPDSGINTAKAYGLEFTPTPDGEQMHGIVTHVIDQDGVMRARFHSLRFQPFRLTAFVNTLLYPDHDETWAGAGSALLRWWKTPQDRWFIGLLVLGFPLLVLSGLALRRYKARRRSVAPDSGRSVNATRDARDAGSSRPDA